MNIILIITVLIFIFLFIVNYKGAIGRIERKNQITGEYQDSGPVTKKEELAFIEGTHKKLAFFQALIGSIVWSLIAFGIMYLIKYIFFRVVV
jgi:hypothetical protein